MVLHFCHVQLVFQLRDSDLCLLQLCPRLLLILALAAPVLQPGAPFLYYGDEIGMRYLPLPTKEGGYFRTGSRTPMQWDNSANLGISAAAADKLYLPVDPAADAPTVTA